MKRFSNLILVLLFFTQQVFGATKFIQGDIWKSNDITRIYTPPSATATLLGANSVQVITNKDIDGGTASNTSRITVPKAAKTTLDSLTRKQGTIVYDTTSNKPYYDDGSTLKVIGSGSGGGINLINDGDAEGSNPFTAYKDAAISSPTDGTGGTPSFVSIAISSTTPLSGVNSFVVTKSFGNPIGEGVSVPFTVQPAYKARMLKISFDYFASTSFEPPYSGFNSDITVWIYDVTAGKVIQPSSFQITSRDTNGTFQGDFQTDSASTNYRLILHCGTVNTAAWTFKADNFSVAPSNYIYAATDTEWAAYTPTIVGFGTHTLSEASWKRSGDSILIKGRLTTGTSNGSVVSITLPNNYVISSSKSTIQANYGQMVNNSVPGNFTLLATGGNSFINVGNVGGSTGLSAAVGTTVAGNTQAVSWYSQPIPIQGWTSGSQQSDSYDARELSLSMFTSTAQLLTTATFTKKIFSTTEISKGLTWDSTNNRVVAVSAGTYSISAFARFGLTTAYTGQILIYKNGVATSLYGSIVSTEVGVSVAGQLLLNANDYIEVFVYQNAGVNLNCTGANLHITKVLAPTTTSANATNILRYTGTAAHTLTSSTQAYKFNTKDYDDFGLYDTSTGFITIKEAGRYAISAKIRMVAPAATISYGIRIEVNGSQKNVNGESVTTSYAFIAKIEDTLDLKTGDVIRISYEISSGTGSVNSGAGENVLTLSRVK